MRHSLYRVALLLLLAILVVAVAPSGVFASPQPTTVQAISAAPTVQPNCASDSADLELLTLWFLDPRGQSSQWLGSPASSGCERDDITVLSSTPSLARKQG